MTAPKPLKFIPGTKVTSWADVCSIGRKLDDECKLDYCEPSKHTDGSLFASIYRSEKEENMSISRLIHL